MVCKKPMVMIIDDEQAVCGVLYEELSEQGFLCATAFNGEEALVELSRQHFDVVLVDIKLPGMSGIEVLSKIKSNHPNIKAVMITGIDNVEVAVETMKLGASDYIVKPFNLDRVNTSISTILGSKKCLPERRDCEIPDCVVGKEEDKPAAEEPHSQMNSIAYGVEAKYDCLLGYSKIVTQRTIEIAQQLGIPEKEIQRWAVAKSRHDAERNTATKSLLNKLQRSPLAQRIMGIAVPYPYTLKPDESQN